MLTIIPPFILLILSMSAGLLNGCLRNVYGKKYSRTEADVSAFTLIMLVGSFVLLVLLSENFTVSLYTVVLGVLYGLVTLIGTLFNMKVLICGPMALSTIICSASMMIPALSGALFWQEHISLLHWIGMALMLVMLPFTAKGSNDKPVSLRWLLYCGGACLASGLVGILQKVHQTSAYKDELDSFLLLAFFFSIVFNAVLLWRNYRRGERISCSFSPRHSVFWMAVLSAVGIALPNKINMYLSGVMDSAIFFPLVNGGSLLLSLLAAIVLFRERPTRRQVIGIVIGLAAVLCLCL